MSKINATLGFIFALGLFLCGSCSQEGRGFALPAGSIEAGKASFVKLECNQCHSIGDIQSKGDNDLNVKLGGEVAPMKSYGELVTSVINPSHKMAKAPKQTVTTAAGHSKMRNYNEIMTVQELVDVVTFLQSEYDLKIPSDYYYPY